MLAARRHRGHRLRHAAAGAGGLVHVAGSGIAGRLLDAQHPRVVAVTAVEARDLDRVRPALGRDHGHFFVGEAAVVGHVEDGLAERVLRHVVERLGRDRLRPLAEVERNVTRCGSRRRRDAACAAVRSSARRRRGRRPPSDGSGGSSAARRRRPGPGRSRGPSRSTCSRGRACRAGSAAQSGVARSPARPAR